VVDDPAALPAVVPFVDELVVVPPAAELPPVELLPLCASANVLDSAKAAANAIVESFIIVFSRFVDRGQLRPKP
jgi:hypothetical protein